ncbi:8382_t:CDS:2, partial [Cetraspora pellucida]
LFKVSSMNQQYSNQETSEEQNIHLERRHERDQLRRERETSEEYDSRRKKGRERMQRHRAKKIYEQVILEASQTEQFQSNNIQELTQYDRQLLVEFCNYMANIKNSHCPTYNEFFPTINLNNEYTIENDEQDDLLDEIRLN